MALIANGGGGATRPTPPTVPPGAYDWYRPGSSPYTPARQPAQTSQYWPSMDVLEAERIDAQRGAVGGWPAQERLGRQVFPTGEQGVTINVGQPSAPAWQQPSAPAWQPTTSGGQPPTSGSQPPPSQPPAVPGAGTDWANLFSPTFAGEGAPSDFLRLTSADWRAMPREVRVELERWLRMLGWRPGGTWGRYGATSWQRAPGATPWAQNGYLGESAFAGISDKAKPWIWYLSQAKGWAQGEAARPPTQGWGW